MDSPRGRIYLMRAFDEGRAQITESFVEHMFRCLDCRACEPRVRQECIGAMMEEMRGKSVDEQSAHWLSRLILNHIFLIREISDRITHVAVLSDIRLSGPIA